MAKKTFLNNPALQFITQQEQAELPELNVPELNVPEIEISGFALPAKKETEAKTRRVQLVLPPSLHAQMLEEAKMLGYSFNEFVNLLARTYFETKKGQ